MPGVCGSVREGLVKWQGEWNGVGSKKSTTELQHCSRASLVAFTWSSCSLWVVLVVWGWVVVFVFVCLGTNLILFVIQAYNHLSQIQYQMQFQFVDLLKGFLQFFYWDDRKKKSSAKYWYLIKCVTKLKKWEQICIGKACEHTGFPQAISQVLCEAFYFTGSPSILPSWHTDTQSALKTPGL